MNYSSNPQETITKLRERVAELRKENEDLKTTVKTLANIKKPGRKKKVEDGGSDTPTNG